MNWKPYLTIAIASFLSHSTGMDALAQVVRSGAVTIQVPSKVSANTIDYVNAKPMDLPKTSAAPADLIRALTSQSPSLGTPGSAAGGAGNGKLAPVWLGIPTSAADDEIAPQEFGTSNHPFSTARADLSIATNTAYPYAASGKLFFNIGTGTFVCSASLIKRGLVVTAAHCVARFGASQFYTNFRFVPGYRNGLAPFGVWTGGAIVMTSYFNGTTPCSTPGVVCRDDVAVIRLTSQAAYPGAIAYPGTATSWYGYGWDGFGFTAAKLTHITQIGYPVCLDNGQLMERNDSHGFTNAAQVNNTIIGSLMCGGSSGGPWLVNFGIRPALTGTTNGTAPNPNIVVGTTSWGFVSTAIKQQGASPFLSTNIVPLVNAACGSPVSNPACL
jgi:V8-like Glu-specific endopeptidase